GPTDFTGTSELWARGDSAALQALYDLICQQAHQLASDGDPDHVGARKAKALTGLTGGEQVPDRVRLYFHVNAADLDDEAIGQVERLGPATLTKLKDWIATRRVTVLPVLDTGRTDAVDTHDPPPRMRELVILRDRHCVFPGCERDARRCDLDHTTPYDEHGPHGQTRPENLAALCRRHHRAKTTGLWSYTRAPSGRYTWVGPHGLTHPGVEVV
ncbi:MAG: HNH endonuclease signature motif containing protein, partial [Nocardioides sp.]